MKSKWFHLGIKDNHLTDYYIFAELYMCKCISTAVETSCWCLQIYSDKYADLLKNKNVFRINVFHFMISQFNRYFWLLSLPKTDISLLSRALFGSDIQLPKFEQC